MRTVWALLGGVTVFGLGSLIAQQNNSQPTSQ